jgi:TolB-like protein/Tfp pilus assembly protein PilF
MLNTPSLASPPTHKIRFDRYEADLQSGELRKSGIRLGIRDQSFQVLATLLEHAGQTVTRTHLCDILWHGNALIDFDNNLNAIVAHLREVLCDSAEHPRFIETVPRRGYRFIAETYAPPPVASAKRLRPRLVVLPFTNLSGDPAREYFSDAMTDEVTTVLASLAPEHIAVIARTTAMHYKGSHKDVARIARELNVDYVVEGSVRQNGVRTVLNVQLIKTADQAHLFAGKYEAKPEEIFSVQNSLARELATHIDVPGTADEIRSRTASEQLKKPTEDLAAYNEYIQGRYLAERLTPDAMASAKQHFAEAIRRDPDFTLAHIALANLYSMVGYIGYMRPRDAYSVGITYALRAAQLSDHLAEAHAVLAEYHKQLDFNWAAAEREMNRALELNPSSPFVKLRHAYVILMPRNRTREAVNEIEQALESDPLAGATRFWLGIMLLLDRQYDRAIEEARSLLELEPSLPWAHFTLGLAYRQKYYEATHGIASAQGPQTLSFWADQAIAEHLKAIEISAGTEYFHGWLGLAYAACDRPQDARSLLAQLHSSERYNLPTAFGHIHLGLGELDAAFELFERAVEERDQAMMPILSYAHYDPIRNDPRFAVLLRSMKLS